MNKKILTHHTGHSFYRSIVRNLVQHHASSYDINIQILHRDLFNIVHHTKPHIVFLPVAEYTQEFHDFITEYHETISIVLLVDRHVQNTDLIQFWKNTNIRIVVDERLSPAYLHHKNIAYPRLYDNDIFYHTNSTRNHKIAVILSADDARNNTLLNKNWLYPDNTSSPIVLFNNPNFKHPQNIGIFNNADLSVVLNTFSYLIDIDDQFPIEAQVCGINRLDIDQITNINNPETYILQDPIVDAKDIEYRSNKFFVKEKLLPFLN